MKICDYFLNQPSVFENKLMYAELMSEYDCNVDCKYGYIDGAKYTEGNKSISDLEAHIEQYIKSNSKLDDYDKAYISAIRDYIKERQVS